MGVCTCVAVCVCVSVCRSVYAGVEGGRGLCQCSYRLWMIRTARMSIRSTGETFIGTLHTDGGPFFANGTNSIFGFTAGLQDDLLLNDASRPSRLCRGLRVAARPRVSHRGAS